MLPQLGQLGPSRLRSNNHLLSLCQGQPDIGQVRQVVAADVLLNLLQLPPERPNQELKLLQFTLSGHPAKHTIQLVAFLDALQHPAAVGVGRHLLLVVDGTAPIYWQPLPGHPLLLFLALLQNQVDLLFSDRLQIVVLYNVVVGVLCDTFKVVHT